MARWLEIEAKHRRMLGMHTSLADFTVGRAAPADPAVARRGELSLYCLDHDRRQAIFVELPEGGAPEDASFLYLHQYETAGRLLSLPYSEFLGVADTLGEIRRFVMIYMTGRCGSTLISHALNEVEGVLSLSEPDAPVGLVHVQRAGAATPDEMRALLRASVRFLFRKGDGSLPAVCALKMRNESIQLAGLMRDAVPQEIPLFLYRDAVGWVGSMYRILMRLGLGQPRSVADACEDMNRCYAIDAAPLLPLLGREATDVALVEYLTLWWVAVIEEYLEAVERGLGATAFRYEDISGRPERSLPEILRACDLPPEAVAGAMRAYGRDSQGGTHMAKAAAGEGHLALTREQVGLVEAIVARHPVIRDPRIEVPGTVRLG